MGFQQATIPIQNADAFSRLRGLMDAALQPANAPKFLGAVVGSSLVVWNLEEILRRSLFEKVTSAVIGQAQKSYAELPVSDQAQIREFYLTRVEQVDGELRQKYKKAFRYL